MSKQKLYKSTECKISTPVDLKSLLEQTKLVAVNILGLLYICVCSINVITFKPSLCFVIYIYIYIYIYRYMCVACV